MPETNKKSFRKIWAKIKARGFTLMAVPNAGGKPPRRLHISLTFLLFLFLVGAIFTGLNIYVWIAYPAKLNDIHSLYQEIERRDQTISRLDKENKEIQPSIERSLEQAKRLEEIERLEAEAKILIDAVKNKGSRAVSTTSSRGLILRNRLSENIKTEVVADDGIDSRLATLDRNLDILEKELDEREKSVNKLVVDLKNTINTLDHTPSVWPVSGKITSNFGTRKDPFTGVLKTHKGLDLKAYTGQPVKATAAGKVIFAGWASGYGYKVEIDHGNGYRSVYAHNSKLAVKYGQQVKKGQVICYAGSTGRSTAPHVHFEIKKNGTPVNPSTVLAQF
ncbi:MAG: peptidoglycan DD-metalloendopeptidase family protein [Bacillota bacterium]|jgi:murein DD-endopeptidase MepM/ murein hydrolase activator NlpD